MADDSRIKDILYKRKNGENIIDDYDVLNACKTEQSRDIIDNARLGSYDKFGNYIIIPEIKNELIDLPKLIYNVKTQDGNIVYDLRANIPVFGDIFFKLSFSKHEAVLSLVETVYREANQYLETYTEPLEALAFGEGALSEDIIMRSFNVFDSPGDFGKNLKYVDLNGILTRKVYLTLLSREIKDITKFDEHAAFDKMISTLKNSGEYGRRVLNEFLERIKDRPAIFEIDMTENYNKAVNEILLSSLDIATTAEDKENFETRQAYLNVLNARNENINESLVEANKNIDEDYVRGAVEDITEDYYKNNRKNNETIEEFFERIKDKKSVPTKRKLDKPVLKQGKEEKEKTKEEKIKELLNKKEKKDQVKRTAKGKKLSPAKAKQKSSKLKPKKAKKSAKKKLPSKKKIARKKAKKSLGKGKLKSKKKKQKKAKSPAKAKAKGQKLQTVKSQAPSKSGKAQKNPLQMTRLLFVNKFYDKIEKNDLDKAFYGKQDEKLLDKGQKHSFNNNTKYDTHLFSHNREEIFNSSFGRHEERLEVKNGKEDNLTVRRNDQREDFGGFRFDDSKADNISQFNLDNRGGQVTTEAKGEGTVQDGLNQTEINNTYINDPNALKTDIPQFAPDTNPEVSLDNDLNN